MANEIGPIFGTPGTTYYATADGVGTDATKVRNTTTDAWETLDTNARAQYAIALTETPSGKGKFYGSLPTGLSPRMRYVLTVYKQSGGSPSAVDDERVASSEVGPRSSELTGGAVTDLVAAIWAGLTSAFLNKIADAVLRRSSASARASEDGDPVAPQSLLGGVAKLTNRTRVNDADQKLEVYEEDGATVDWTQALTKSATASPVTEMGSPVDV